MDGVENTERFALLRVLRSQSFAPELEEAFQRSLDEPRRESARVGAVLSSLLFVLFGFLDVLAIPSALREVMFIRLGCVVPFQMLILWSTWQPFFTRHYRLLMAAMYLGMGLGIQWMILLANADELAHLSYYAGLILVVFALYTWTYLSAHHAAKIGFGLVVAYATLDLVTLPTHQESPIASYEQSAVLLSNVFFFASANVVGLVGVLLRERHLREAFLLRKQAEALARVKSTFLANMSHEIRTPLNGVLGLAQLGYLESVGNPLLQGRFARILDSGRVLLVVLNDILDFSKIEAGRLELESIPFSLETVTRDAVESLRGQAEGKGLRLSCSCDDLPAASLGDPVRISQILLNLVANALKFTERGAVSVHVHTLEAALRVEIRDTGIGISPAALQRLFRPFEQADSSTTRKFGGSGLGLAISARLAELMGGHLSAESQEGQGSTFILHLPLKQTTESVRPPLPLPVAGVPRLKHLRILVAEDHEVNQLVLMDVLQREGADVTLAANGRLALEAVANASSPFSVVLMDVQMPELDGLETTRRLRGSNPTLPIIGQTAHALKEEHDKCITAGMRATVTKPIDVELLVTTLLTHCPPPPESEPPAHQPEALEPGMRDKASEPRAEAGAGETTGETTAETDRPEQISSSSSERTSEQVPPSVLEPVSADEPASAPVAGDEPASAPAGVAEEHAKTSVTLEGVGAIDWPKLDARYAHRPEFVEKLVQLALSAYGGSLEQVRSCLERGDLVGLSQLAHSLKGVAGNLCATELETSAREVLEKTRATDGSGLVAGVQLARALERFMGELKEGRRR